MRKRNFIVWLLCFFLLSGCTAPTHHKSSEKLRVMTSFYPVYLIAQAVTHDVEGVELTNLTAPQTGCLHDYTLLPQDVKALEQADVFVVNGLGMESFLDKVTATRPDLKIVDLSAGIQPMDDNAHIWLSPQYAQSMATTLQTELSALLPSERARLAQNATDFRVRLTELEQDMQQKLQGIRSRDIVTFHEAFSYFARDFDLNIRAVIEREPGEAPTPRELSETIDIVRQTNVKALFVEPQYPDDAAKAIAAETGAKVYSLDPVVTGENTASYEEYFARMTANADVLAQALR